MNSVDLLESVLVEAMPLRVLIVEDSRGDALLIEHELTDAGFQVEARRVETAAEMRAALQSQAWDIVLSDHSMPQFSLHQALQELQASGVQTPLIVVSGQIGEEAAVAALKQGASDYVPKARLQTLAAAVGRCLREGEAQRAQHHAEAALRDSEFRYRTLIENASDLICEADAQGIFRYLSPNYETVLGWSPEELLNTSLFERLHPDDCARVAMECARFFNEGIGKSEFRYGTKSGQWRWFESTGRALITAEGGARVVIISRDTTGRKRHEIESNALLAVSRAVSAQDDLLSIARGLSRHLRPLPSLAFDRLNLAVLHEEAASDLVEPRVAASQASCETCDKQSLEWLAADESGAHYLSTFTLWRQEEPDHPAWRALDRHEFQLENDWRQQHPDSRFGSLLTAPLVADGRTLGLLQFAALRGAAFDDEDVRLAELIASQVAIAVRKAQLMAQTRQAEARFHSIFDSTLDAMLIRDGEGRCLQVNPASCALLGREANEILGHTLAEFVPPADLPLVGQLWETFLRTGSGRSEFRLLRPNGEVCEVECMARAHFLPGLHLSVMRDMSERKRSADALRESEARFRDLFLYSPDPVFVEDLQGIVLDVNPAACRLHGLTREQLIGQRALDLVPHSHHPALLRDFPRLASGAVSSIEGWSQTASGGAIPVEIRAGRINYLGRPALLLHVRDMSERKRAEAALWQSNAVLQATQEAAADGIFLVDGDGHVVSFNRRFTQMWRVPEDQVEELKRTGELMTFILNTLRDPDEFIEKFIFLFDRPDDKSRDEITLKDGRVFERYSSPALLPDGRFYGRVWSFSDITERKKYERELAHQAFHDPLTGLPNRALFMDNLSRALARAGRSRRPMAVMFMDLDRFKLVNDSLGHAEGDELLRQAARRLERCLRPGDTAARFGGDEFTVLLEELPSQEDATRVAERIVEALGTPFILSGPGGARHEVYSSVSIGIVLSTGATDERAETRDRPDDLLRNADMAMYRAKNKGKARYEIFDARTGGSALERLQLEVDLRQAIARGQMRLHFQPLVGLQSGRIIGFEALSRWERPGFGLISPVDFIPLAEETGLILPLGRWVLEEACRQVRIWRDAWPDPDTTPQVSVNLSALQFGQADLAEQIERVLSHSGLPPECLKLEITESVIMGDAQSTIAQLQTLKQLGVQLAIDDFGTGYSSLSYLQRFQVDTLKIDRSFVSRIAESGEDAAIVRAVTTLGQALGLEVTAEGIETQEQLAHLRELGCRTGQGFLFAIALTAEAALELIKANPHW